MAREIIKPLVGQQPIIIKLDTDQPVQVEGRFGVEYQYTLNDDGAIMWLKKEGKAAIDAIGVKAGDEIAISKIKRGRSDIWIAEKVEDEPTPPATKRAATDHRSSRTPDWVNAPEEQVGKPPYDEVVRREKAEEARSRMMTRPGSARNLTDQELKDLGLRGNPEPQDTQQSKASPAPEPNRPAAKLLTAALYAAIDAAGAAESYARVKGRAIAFGVDDIRAMAATLYIDAKKEGR